MARRRHGAKGFDKVIEILREQERNAIRNAENRQKVAAAIIDVLEDGKWYAEQYEKQEKKSDE